MGSFTLQRCPRGCLPSRRQRNTGRGMHSVDSTSRSLLQAALGSAPSSRQLWGLQAKLNGKIQQLPVRRLEASVDKPWRSTVFVDSYDRNIPTTCCTAGSDDLPPLIDFSELSKIQEKTQRAVLSNFPLQALALLVATSTVIFSFAFVYELFTETDLEESLFSSLTFVLDASAFSEESTDVGKFIGLFAGLFGLFFVSVLIGIVNEFIDARLKKLGEGVQRISETDHTVVLNWGENTGLLLQKLCAGFASSNSLNRLIVVIAQHPYKEMLQVVQQEVPDTYGTEIVCLNADPTRVNNLRIVSADKARCIIVSAFSKDPLENDIAQINMLTTLETLMTPTAYAVTEVMREETERVLQANFSRARPMVMGSTSANLTTQTLLDEGMATVWTNILRDSGPIIYRALVPAAMNGMEYGDLFDVVKNVGIPMGLIPAAGPNKGELLVMPPDEYVMQAGEAIIALVFVQDTRKFSDCMSNWQGQSSYRDCVSDEACSVINERRGDGNADDAAVEEIEAQGEMNGVMWKLRSWAASVLGLADPVDDLETGKIKGLMQDPKGKWLVCGWHPGMSNIIQALNGAAQFGSEVHVLSCVPNEERDKLLILDGLDMDSIQTVCLVHHEGAVTNRQELEALPVEQFNGVLFLAGTDAVVGSIQVRDVLKARGRNHYVHMVAEIDGLPTDSQTEASVEVVSSGELDTLCVAMVAVEDQTYQFLKQTFRPDGVKISTIAASRLVNLADKSSFQQLQARCRFNFGVTLLGYFDSAGNVTLNPPDKDAKKDWTGVKAIIMTSPLSE